METLKGLWIEAIVFRSSFFHCQMRAVSTLLFRPLMTVHPQTDSGAGAAGVWFLPWPLPLPLGVDGVAIRVRREPCI